MPPRSRRARTDRRYSDVSGARRHRRRLSRGRGAPPRWSILAHHPLVHDQESARERDDDLDPAKQQGKPELRHGEKTNEELDPRDHEDRPERPADWGLGGDQDRYTRGDEPEGGDLRR